MASPSDSSATPRSHGSSDEPVEKLGIARVDEVGEQTGVGYGVPSQSPLYRGSFGVHLLCHPGRELIELLLFLFGGFRWVF